MCPASGLTSRQGGRLAQPWHRSLIYWTRNTHISLQEEQPDAAICPGNGPGSPRSLQEYLYKATALPPGPRGEDGGSNSPCPCGSSCEDQPCPGPDACVVDQRLPSSQPLTSPPTRRKPLPQTPCNTLPPGLPPAPNAAPWSHARLASPGWEEGAWMLSADPPPDPGLPGMLQGSEPDTKSHGSHLGGRLGVLRGCPCCLPHTPFHGPAEEPAVHTALPRGVLLESILSRALASQLLKGSGAPSPPSSAGSSFLPGAPPSCFTGRAWPLHCRPASGGGAQAGGMGRAAGSPELGDSSLWPHIHTGPGVLPHLAPRPISSVP